MLPLCNPTPLGIITLVDEFAALLAGVTKDGQLDEEAFLLAQARLDFPERQRLRCLPALAESCFGLRGLAQLRVPSNYWDTTTLCMRRPLLEVVKDGARVLEIGPGPSATLTLFLAKHRRELQLTCAEINPEFVRSARAVAELNGVTADIRESDVTAAVEGQTFDVVLMNPPYVKDATASALGIERGSSLGLGSYGGSSGTDVIARFLDRAITVLAPNGVTVLGVNNWHLEDQAVAGCIERSRFALLRRWYPPSKVAPHGPYAQVYLLGARS